MCVCLYDCIYVYIYDYHQLFIHTFNILSLPLFLFWLCSRGLSLPRAVINTSNLAESVSVSSREAEGSLNGEGERRGLPPGCNKVAEAASPSPISNALDRTRSKSESRAAPPLPPAASLTHSPHVALPQRPRGHWPADR